MLLLSVLFSYFVVFAGYILCPVLKGMRHVPSVHCTLSYCHHLSLSLKILITKICLPFSKRKQRKHNDFFFSMYAHQHTSTHAHKYEYGVAKEKNSKEENKKKSTSHTKYTKCMWKSIFTLNGVIAFRLFIKWTTSNATETQNHSRCQNNNNQPQRDSEMIKKKENKEISYRDESFKT